MQGDIRNESTYGLVMERFGGLFKSGLDVWCSRIKKVIKIIGSVYWVSKKFILTINNCFGGFLFLGKLLI